MVQSNSPPTDKSMSHFLTLPSERLLFAKRKHWITLAIPLLVQGWIGLMLIGLLYLFLAFFFQQMLLFIISSATLLLLILSIMVKTAVDWYFHFYIITNRKIIEYHCTPLFSHSINEVLLDHVRCTEIDVNTEGLVNHLVNKGDVTVTFDRPTHEEELMLTDIHDPRQVGATLADAFDMYRSDVSQEGAWFRPRGNSRRYFFTDDLTRSYQGGYL